METKHHSISIHLRHAMAIASALLALAIPKLATAQQSATTRPVAAPEKLAVTLKLKFKDAPVDDVLHAICAAGGWQLVELRPINRRMTFISDTPITPQRALEILNSLLANNGYAAVLQGTVLKLDFAVDFRHELTVEEAVGWVKLEKDFGCKGD